MQKSTLRGTTILFASLFAISCIIMPANAASTWTIETADSDGLVGLGPSIVIDNLGHPWISYSDGTDNPDFHLKVAHFTGTSWEATTVDATGDTVTAIALDNTGAPVVAYQDSTTWRVELAKLVGTTWLVETIDPNCQASSGISLVIDTTGKPHIAYIDKSDLAYTYLKYAVFSGSAWSIETVTDECSGIDSSAVSLQLNSGGTPYISYYNLASNDLVCAKKVGGIWLEEIVAPGDSEYPSLRLNAAGNPCVSYLRTDGVYYAYFDGSLWHREKVDSFTVMSYSTSLVLDSAGHPHISYYDPVNCDLKYAYYDGVAWQKETVDAAGDIGASSSIALDSFGAPYIGYLDSINYVVKCAFIKTMLTTTPESDGAGVLLFSVVAAVGCYVGLKRRTK